MSARSTVPALGLILAALTLAPAAPKDGDDRGDVEAILKSQVEMARKGLKLHEQMVARALATRADRMFHVWSHRLMEAELALARSQAEEVAAVEAHLERTKNMLADSEKLYQGGEIDLKAFLEAQYLRSEDELLLARTRAGRKGSGGSP